MGEVERVNRPWTVVVLVLWGLGSALWALFFGHGSWTDQILNIGFTALFTWGLWTGKRWAFLLTLAGALAMLVVVAVETFLDPPKMDTLGKIVFVITAVGTLYLLRHPLTKRFVNPDWDSQRNAGTGPPDRGGRVAQATAIALFGIFAAGVPILWTVGVLEGPLLIAGTVACIGSGLAVLYLSSPAKREGLPPSSEIA